VFLIEKSVKQGEICKEIKDDEEFRDTNLWASATPLVENAKKVIAGNGMKDIKKNT